jgi:hypothetical protein
MVALVLILVAHNIDTINSQNIKVYNETTNTYSAYGVSFNYPNNWDASTYSEQGSDSIVLHIPLNETIVESEITEEPKTIVVEPVFEINIYKNLGNLGEYDPNTIIIDTDDNNSTDRNKISKRTLIIDGNTAIEDVYIVNNTTSFPEVYKVKEIFLVKKGFIYSISFYSPVNSFDSNKPIFDMILNSIKIQ